jgi:uncharacterized repeat protein (TIGR03803 family)
MPDAQNPQLQERKFMNLLLPVKTLRNRLSHAAILLFLVPCTLAATNFQNLYSFTGGNAGQGPLAGLVADGSGNLFGTTVGGGTHACGTIFELSHTNGAWSEKVLYSFTCGNDGRYPSASLIFDEAGNLYGTTAGLYTVSNGNVFELVHQKNDRWTLKVLYSFSGKGDGTNPVAGLVLDQGGNLYGTAPRGAEGFGAVFELQPNGHGSWKEKVLHRFANGRDGAFPMAALTSDSAGNIYGTAEYGGGVPPCGGCGAVFRLTPQQNGNWKYQVIHRFRGTDGSFPFASMIVDAQGNLYGTTLSGGPKGGGTVFELMKNQNGHWGRRSLHNFGLNPLTGLGPQTALFFDTSGNLWGTTLEGGNLGCNYGCGVVFELTPDGQGQWNESVAHTFVGNPGYYPAGTTEGDGKLTFGSVYEITP